MYAFDLTRKLCVNCDCLRISQLAKERGNSKIKSSSCAKKWRSNWTNAYVKADSSRQTDRNGRVLLNIFCEIILQGVSYWNVSFKMALTDRIVQVRFFLKVSVYSWGLEIWVPSIRFQKINIGCIFLSVRGILKETFQCETPCIYWIQELHKFVVISKKVNKF